MKAKEYAQILKDKNYDNESLDSVIKGLLDEIVSISKARGVKTLSGLNGVVQEIRQKWVAIYNRSDGHLNKNGLDDYLISKRFLNLDCSINVNLFREKFM